MPNRGLSTARGVTRGFEKGTSTLLSIMQAKAKIDDAKERTKVLNKYSTAQTDLAELKLKDATRKAAMDEKFMDLISGSNRGGGRVNLPSAGAGAGAGAGGGVDPGTVPITDIAPGFDISREIGGTRFTRRAPSKLTTFQRQQEATRLREVGTQKSGALGAVNAIKEQILEKGTISGTKAGVEKPYSRGLAQAYIAKNYPKVDINDPDVQASIFSLENMAPDFRPSSGIKALIGKGRAKLSRNTKEIIRNIDSQEALDKVIGNREEFEANDVDVDAIMEYFGQIK